MEDETEQEDAEGENGGRDRMDAAKYLRERARMCAEYALCKGCPIGHGECRTMEAQEPERIVAIVEEWAKEHPVETRQSRFLKEFPNASVQMDGTIDICPRYMDKTLECKAWGDVVKERDVVKECIECEREFWGTEV